MLTLLPDNDPILRQVAEPVTEFGDELHQLCRAMAKVMVENNGIGLAAPQVGISKRIIIANVGIVGGLLINPEIIEQDGEYNYKEGCLTFPGLFLEVKRAQKVTVRYQEIEGKEREATMHNLFAVVIQHEIDHLNGKLFVDRVSPIALALARKKLMQRN
ncbi:peptide deformylase [Candidatus Thorarchaeota archaeon]|nr:MAG: peptide deformylase [Candidatus Thorarchaeota archaeon]